MAAAKAKKAHLAHQHHHYRRAALAPLSKPNSESVEAQTYPFGIISDQMSIAGALHPGRTSRGRVVVEDENTPFDAQYAYGAPLLNKHRPFAQGVIGHQLGGVPMSGLHVLPDISSQDRHYRRQQQHRHSLSSWPPSPNGFPPTPTFDDDVYRAPSGDATHRHSMTVWPPGFGESSLISGGGGSYLTTAAPEADVDITLVEENPSPSLEDAHIKLVPSPRELLRIANEQARANAATNLSDWASEVLWEMCVPIMGGSEYVPTFRRPRQKVDLRKLSRSSPLSSVTLRRSQSLSANILVPPPFKRFAQQTIYQVSASAGSLFLALWYIRRLPIGPAYTADGEKILFNDRERAFRDDLFAMRSEIPWRLLVLGLTLSNKWLEDNTFTTKTWYALAFVFCPRTPPDSYDRNEVTGLSLPSMKSVETKALSLFEWILSPKLDEWLDFLQQLHNREVANHIATLPSAIGSERRSSMSMSFSYSESSSGKRPLLVIDELMAEVHATTATFDPVFPGVPSVSSLGGSSTLTSPASPASLLSEPSTTTSSAQSLLRPSSPPHVENNWRNRPASWSEIRHDLPLEERQQPPRASSDELMSRFSIRPRRIKTPAAWDPAASALDSPILRGDVVSRKARPTYEAVRRPSSLLLIPPPPRFDDYSNASFVPRAKYEEANDNMLNDPDVTYVPQPSFPLHYESSDEADRAWYDAKLPRTIMGETHGSSWTASFAGMISSF